MKELIRKILNEEDRRKNKTQQFQKLIDDEIESMKEICKQMSADDEESISFDACDFLDLDPKVIVTDVDKFYGKLRILVVIKYEATMHFHDEEAFIYELQWRLKWVGNVMIDVEDVINTYPNKLNETFTGDTPTDITKQFINKPVKLIGDVNTTTKIQNINVNNDGSVNISFQNGMKVNSSLPMLRRFNLEVDIPLEFKIKKKGSINESEGKKGKYITMIKDLTDYFKNEDCVCDIQVEHKPEEFRDSYLITVVLGTIDLDNKFNGISWQISEYRTKLKRKITNGILEFLPIPFYIEFRQTPKCYKDLNESEETKPGKYARALEIITDTLKHEDFVCDIEVKYYGAADTYEIIVKIDKKEMETNFEKLSIWYAEKLIKEYLIDLRKKVETEIRDFLPVKVLIYIDQFSCNKKLNESEEKKSRLLSNIEKNGLYEVISSTGLHINEIEQKVGQLSREVLERFIKDVVKEHFQVIDDDGKTYIIYLEDYPFDVVPIGNSDYIEQLRVIDNKLIFVVALYDEDEYGDQEFSSEELTPSENLSYDYIYEIAGQIGYLLVKGQI